MGNICMKPASTPQLCRGRIEKAFTYSGLGLNLGHVITHGVAADVYARSLALPRDIEASTNLISLLIAVMTILLILWGMVMRLVDRIAHHRARTQQPSGLNPAEVECGPTSEVSGLEAITWNTWRFARSV